MVHTGSDPEFSDFGVSPCDDLRVTLLAIMIASSDITSQPVKYGSGPVLACNGPLWLVNLTVDLHIG